MLIGKRVVTPDGEKGFISQTYIGGGVDVDVLEYDAETPEHTTSFYYEAGEYEVSKDQTPQLFDLTPFGKIRLVEHIYEGLIHVEFFDEYEKFALWISEEQMLLCRSKYEVEWAHWVKHEDVDKVLPYLKLIGVLA